MATERPQPTGSAESTGSADSAEDPVRARAVRTASELFYAHGVQAVGMDRIRTESGVSLKRLYQLFPSKQELVAAVLRERDRQVCGSVRACCERAGDGTDDPDAPLLAVFDWLAGWFSEPGFRGCAFVNSLGELGGDHRPVRDLVLAHKTAFRREIADRAADAGLPPHLADQLALLAEGAITVAHVTGSPASAGTAKEAARVLITAARGPA